GIRADAPVWMQRNGLQWCFRLFQEPRRLARRYLRIVPSFLLHASLQLLGIRRYELRETDDAACPHETKQGLS
ncbi:MAG: WecB/TagA/CpsF family glycosyltransferase, partial [Verrucomicrobia bacterium]|nr:WecB/TagA/CpsF family glycosyltransferase [Verrucomicrobiota bacterium]